MAELRSYLAGLKAELAAAETLGRDTVEDIKAEIARIEGEVAKVAHVAGVEAVDVPKALASDEEKAARYLASLKEELAGAERAKAPNVADIKAEIARVEKAAAPVETAVAAAAADVEKAVAPAAKK